MLTVLDVMLNNSYLSFIILDREKSKQRERKKKFCV